MKKSYHSIAVPTGDAMTALRRCAECSASGSAPAVVAIAIGIPPRFLVSRSGLVVASSPGATILGSGTDGYRAKSRTRSAKGLARDFARLLAPAGRPPHR